MNTSWPWSTRLAGTKGSSLRVSDQIRWASSSWLIIVLDLVPRKAIRESMASTPSRALPAAEPSVAGHAEQPGCHECRTLADAPIAQGFSDSYKKGLGGGLLPRE